MVKGTMMAVIGAQFGSEGKGVVVNSIARDFNVHVRVGSPNAGHTFYWSGAKHVMQSIPCGWTNPNAKVIIGRGALINLKCLMDEIKHVELYYPDFRTRLWIDGMAGILDERFHDEEGGIDGEMHQRIGSTGEGVGPARIARINRDPSNFRFFKDVAFKYGLSQCLKWDTPEYIAKLQDHGYNILLEGTQGSGLSLLHGIYPYVTSIDTNAAQILAECGIAPSRLSNVLLVARTYPIRVAGNSGPLQGELTWDQMSEMMGERMEERTTVTKKVRRIGMWDDELFRRAMVLNQPSSVAITFMDYIDPRVKGADTRDQMTDMAWAFVNRIIREFGVRVSMVGTGGPTCSMIKLAAY